MMLDAIKNFPKQFKFRPKIEGGKIKKYRTYIICGMGGSALAGEILKSIYPNIDIIAHKDYGLPKIDEKKLGKSLVIVSSYSGNTEETLSAYDEARAKNIPVLAIAVGGKLLELAKSNSFPFIQLPDTGIQPRCALGLSIKALMKAMKLNDALKEISGLAKTLDPKSLEEQGKNLAQKLKGRVPVIYSSARNYSIAYNWKIKFNETGKIPAFYNVSPELNHNEMTGFDVKESSRHLSEKFYFIFLKDRADYERINKRFEVLEKLYQDRGLAVETIELQGEQIFQKIFTSLLLADWAALYTAEQYGLESEEVPMVEEFKKLI